jgi:choline-glycine betaine transporter
MERETLKIPSLVNPENFKKTIPNPTPKVNNGVVKKWNLNIILLISFFLFMLVFLYSCKYGNFSTPDPIPYSI